MEYFGAKQKNVVWSWCGINEEEKAVYFSVWTDYVNKFGDKGRRYYTIQEPHWGLNEETGSFSAARNDHDIKLKELGLKEQELVLKGREIDIKERTPIPSK